MSAMYTDSYSQLAHSGNYTVANDVLVINPTRSPLENLAETWPSKRTHVHTAQYKRLQYRKPSTPIRYCGRRRKLECPGHIANLANITHELEINTYLLYARSNDWGNRSKAVS